MDENNILYSVLFEFSNYTATNRDDTTTTATTTTTTRTTTTTTTTTAPSLSTTDHDLLADSYSVDYSDDCKGVSSADSDESKHDSSDGSNDDSLYIDVTDTPIDTFNRNIYSKVGYGDMPPLEPDTPRPLPTTTPAPVDSPASVSSPSPVPDDVHDNPSEPAACR